MSIKRADRPPSRIQRAAPAFSLFVLCLGGLIVPIAELHPSERAINAEINKLTAFTKFPPRMPGMMANQPDVPGNCSQMTHAELLMRFNPQQPRDQVSTSQLCNDWIQARDSDLNIRDLVTLQRRRHILQWLPHASWSHFAGSAAVHILKSEDHDGHDQLKSFWLAEIEKESVLMEALQNAEIFFENDERPLAEQILIRIRSISNSPQKLGRLYAMSLANVHDVEEFPTQRNWDLVSAHALRPGALNIARTPFARRILRTLETSTDDRLLAQTGLYLVAFSRLNQGSQLWKLGVGYARRATVLNPNSTESRQILNMGLLVREPYVVNR